MIEESTKDYRLYLDSTGAVGIGTSTPSTDATLTLGPIVGDWSAIDFKRSGSTSVWRWVYYDTWFAIEHFTPTKYRPFFVKGEAATDHTLVVDNGKVGIGTLNPYYTFDVPSDSMMAIEARTTLLGTFCPAFGPWVISFQPSVQFFVP